MEQCCTHLGCIFPPQPNLESVDVLRGLGGSNLSQFVDINHHHKGLCWSLRTWNIGGQLPLVWVVVLVYLDNSGVTNSWYLALLLLSKTTQALNQQDSGSTELEGVVDRTKSERK